jgi:hypothetical protein
MEMEDDNPFNQPSRQDIRSAQLATVQNALSSTQASDTFPAINMAQPTFILQAPRQRQKYDPSSIATAQPMKGIHNVRDWASLTDYMSEAQHRKTAANLEDEQKRNLGQKLQYQQWQIILMNKHKNLLIW